MSEVKKCDELWTAYIDGELSATEAHEFDRALTPTQRAQVAAEMRFEDALGRTLGNEAGCPEGLWEDVKARLAAEGGDRPEQAERVLHFKPWVPFAAAAAVAVLFSLGLMIGQQRSNAEHAAGLALADVLRVAPSVSDLSASADWAGDEDEVTRRLQERGFDVAVSKVPESAGGHSGIHFLGARVREVGRESVVQLMWECCGEPVIVNLTAGQSITGERMLSRNDRSVLNARRLGRYVAGVVSSHPAAEMLDLVTAAPAA